MSDIKAIQTRYKGCHFRSRLEARWAIAFDALGINWVYEPQTLTDYEGNPYLPDFWLPDIRTPTDIEGIYVEVKGVITDEVRCRWDSLVDFPPVDGWQKHGLLVATDIPHVSYPECYHDMRSFQFAWMFHNKGVCVMPVALAPHPDQYCLAQMECDGFDSPLSASFVTRGIEYHANNAVSVEALSKMWAVSGRVALASQLARSSRFEHGESGPT